jgi:hypothetical protein
VPPPTTPPTTQPPPTTVAPPTTAPPSTATFGVHVNGANLVDANGNVVQLHGVNRPGLEYECVSGGAFLSGDSGDPITTLAYADTAAAGLNWHGLNVVRVPLNEDCWLGINGVNASFAGANYQAFVTRLVNDLTAAGKYVILDLHWAAAGSFKAVSQNIAADEDHSVTFWTQVASTFKSNPAVIFDLFNEPRLNCGTGSGCPYAGNGNYGQQNGWIWNLYLNGGNYTITSVDSMPSQFVGSTMAIAGNQQLVNAIRFTGANNVIAIEGLGYGNSLDAWSQYVPNDPAHQIMVSAHQYPSSGAKNTSTLTNGWAGHYPMLLGEFGEWDCGSTPGTFAQQEISWANANGYSWTAWGWDAGEGCNGPSVVTSDDNGSASVYGIVIKQSLASMP